MGWADYLADRSARRWLEEVAGRLEPGWRALSADPALWGVFEEHLTAVAEVVRCETELVTRQDPASTLVLIAGHAHDVWTEAEADGWAPPAREQGWTAAEWTGLRVLACFRLAAAEPHGPKLSPAAALVRPRTRGIGKRVR
ncbi:DUF6401 family natural product biosynthesis protein [Amycolatopsis sacchari]|uniref:DUF6401 family natural product biosynthesis protein n=1 Tax=Amycolatopsis sacchari TaxID=115433 RepID=UPI003D70F5FC